MDEKRGPYQYGGLAKVTITVKDLDGSVNVQKLLWDCWIASLASCPTAAALTPPPERQWSSVTINQADFQISIIPDANFLEMPVPTRAHIERSSHWSRCTHIAGWRNDIILSADPAPEQPNPDNMMYGIV